MRTISRARRFALTALCAGGTIGLGGLAVAPGQALAAGPDSCSNVYGSGSTLQTILQQQDFTADAGPGGAFSADCSSTPSVFYNTDISGNPLGGTGSGAGLREFALQPPTGGGSPAVTPADSQNASWLDGFIGTDDPPTASALSTSASVANSDPETVPVFQAPIAVVVNLPAGCTIKASPLFTNTTLSAAFANDSSDSISWTKLLTAAKAKPAGCPTTSPTVQVRFDGSGTSFAFKQYLSQIDSSTWTPYISDNPTWPGTVQTTYTVNGVTTNDQGSGGEATAVEDTKGSIGYVNTADAVSHSLKGWVSGSKKFFVKVQNSGSGTSSVTGAAPATSAGVAKCTTTFDAGKLPTSNEPDWSTVHVAKPLQPSSAYYPICTLTYDVAWQSYVNSSVLAPDYTGQYSGETPAGVETTTKDFLAWELGTTSGDGQTVIPNYYNALPTQVDTDAASIVSKYIGTN